MKLDFKVSGGLPGSEEWKRTKIRSGWLSSSEEWKEPSFVRPFGFINIYESWFVSSEERKRTKIRSGGLPIFGKSGTKIRKIGWISEFRRSGGFPNSEERKIKIRSDGFPNSEDRVDFRILKNGNQDSIGWISEFQSMEKNQDSFWVDFRRSEEKEPRFVNKFGWASKFWRTEKD
ncbi:uncharacterized protein OCT59_016755 [Rhizophagus irregularis]|uniref:uncharacterized protein n=1 Tax=Rhizophagus irregularis TaxID=588596 RepID=UPI00331D3BF6|nr:hypothetical protein OCT59_016755 [Rhizophagus irregularis]